MSSHCSRNEFHFLASPSYTSLFPFPTVLQSSAFSVNKHIEIPILVYHSSINTAAMDLTKRTNDAIHANGDHTVNGGTSDIAITNHGSDWYFVCTSASPSIPLADPIQAVCAVMFAATLVFIGLSYSKPRPHRVFHYITAAITMVAAIAYFTMGADLGQTGIKPEFMRGNSKVSGNLREIFYVRYIDWYATRACGQLSWS